MTQHELKCKCRKATGWMSLLLAFVLTGLVGMKSWRETTRLQSEHVVTNERLDVQGAVEKSDNYPCVVTDEEGKIIQWNYAMQELTGVSLEDANKVGIETFVCGDEDAKRVKAACIDSFKDPDSQGKVLVVPCSVKNIVDRTCTPVHFTVRLEQSQTTGKMFAVARVDRESQIVELGDGKPRHFIGNDLRPASPPEAAAKAAE